MNNLIIVVGALVSVLLIYRWRWVALWAFLYIVCPLYIRLLVSRLTGNPLRQITREKQLGVWVSAKLERVIVEDLRMGHIRVRYEDTLGEVIKQVRDCLAPLRSIR